MHYQQELGLRSVDHEGAQLFPSHDLLHDAACRIVEEGMDYRTFCCARAKASAKPTAALVLKLKVKKDCKIDFPGRNGDFGASFPPMMFQREIPSRFLH